MDKPYCYKYPHPAVSADCVIIDKKRREILLIERKYDPYKDHWSFPGGFVDMEETVEEGAARELMEETGLENVGLELLGVLSDPDRDPRERVINISFIGFVDKNLVNPVAGDDAGKYAWFPLDSMPPLAFDLDKIMPEALGRIDG